MLKRLKDLISDSAVYGASSVIGQLIGFLLLPLYTRFLSPADYGVMAMLAILSTLFTPLANLGMTNAIFRRFSASTGEAERQVVVSTGLLSVVVGSVLLAGILAIVVGGLTRLLLGPEHTDYVLLVKLTLASSVLRTIGDIPVVVLRAERRVRTAGGLNLLGVIVATVLTVWTVAFLRMGVYGLVLAALAAEVVLSLLRFGVTWRSFRPVVDLNTYRSMLSYGLPYTPHRVQAFAMVQFSQYMVGRMLGMGEAGLYSIAVRISTPMQFVVGAIQQAWVPFKFQVHAEDEHAADFFRSVTTYYVAVLSYLWVGLSAWGPEIVRIMTAASFHEAASLIPAVALIPLTQGLYFMFGTGIELSNDTWKLPLVSFAGLTTVVALSFPAIHFFGSFGAGLATVAAWVAMSAGIYRVSQPYYEVDYDWPTLALLAVVSIVVVIACIIVQQEALALRLITATLVSLLYPVGILAVLSRSSTERDRLMRFGSKLSPRFRLILEQFRIAP